MKCHKHNWQLMYDSNKMLICPICEEEKEFIKRKNKSKLKQKLKEVKNGIRQNKGI